jgi:uncharacterized protein (DUF433 family)
MQSGSGYIIATPGVSGGDKHIAGTRIPVWAIEAARRIGIDDGAILEMYPTITRQQLESAKSYADFHVEEMDRLIADCREHRRLA